jgi:hypothetical protein
MSDTVSKCRPFSFIFNLGNKAKSQGAKSDKKGGWEKVAVSHKLCGLQGRMGGSLVLMKAPVQNFS